MSDDSDNFNPSPAAPQEPAKPEPKDYSEAWLAEAIERLKARGDATKRFAVMQLPTPVFNDLCARLLTREHTVKATAEWLRDECMDRDLDPPSRSSVDRFSDVLFEEYRLVKFSRSRERAANYVQQITAGDEEAGVMAMNTRLTELVTDSLMDADSLEDLSDERLFAITGAAKAVAAVKFGKKMLDARVDALRKQIQERDGRIGLIGAELLIKNQKLASLPERVKAVEEKLKQLQAAQREGKKIDAAIYEAIFQELTAIKEPVEPAAAGGVAA